MLLQGEDVTEPMPLSAKLRRTPYRDPRTREEPQLEADTRRRLDLAVRVGELLLRCGAGTRDVEASVVAVAASLGLRRLEVDITNQSLLVQCPSHDGHPLTMLRVVRSSNRDFARLTAVHRFVRRLVSGPIELDAAVAELKELQRQPRMYPRWVIMLGRGGLAGAVAGLLGAGVAAIVVAALAAMVIDRVGQWLSGLSLPGFYVTAVGGAISTLLTWAAYLLCSRPWAPVELTSLDFAYAVAGGIVVQLPGRQMASAVEDAVTGYPVTGAGRLLTVVLDTAGIIVGVAAALSLTLRLDRALDLELTTPGALRFSGAPTALWLMLLCGGLGAAASAVHLRVGPRLLLPVYALGVGALLLSQGLFRFAGIGQTTAVAVAAVVVGALGRMIALRMGAPPVVLVVPAVSPLLPGLRIFQGMYESISGSVLGAQAAASPEVGVGTLIGAAAVALAISTGTLLGDFLVAPLDDSALRRRPRRR